MRDARDTYGDPDDWEFFLHVCKDRTLTVRHKSEPVFNDVALPVARVPLRHVGKQVILALCSKQYEEHPQLPNQPWFKINYNGSDTEDGHNYLDYSDLDGVKAKIDEFLSSYFGIGNTTID